MWPPHCPDSLCRTCLEAKTPCEELGAWGMESPGLKAAAQGLAWQGHARDNGLRDRQIRFQHGCALSGQKTLGLWLNPLKLQLRLHSQQKTPDQPCHKISASKLTVTRKISGAPSPSTHIRFHRGKTLKGKQRQMAATLFVKDRRTISTEEGLK
jgi:hypothetical protein